MKFVITRRDRLYLPDGINIFLFALADALMEMGHEVHVVTTFDAKEQETRRYFQFKHFPTLHALSDKEDMPLAQFLSVWWKRGRPLIRSLNPDVTIVNGVVPFRLAGFTFSVSHDMEPRMNGRQILLRLFKWISYRKADQIVATTTEIRESFAKANGFRAEAIKVIPTCFRLDQYRPLPWEQRENAVLHIGTPDYKRPLVSVRALLRQQAAQKLYLTGKMTEKLAKELEGLSPEERARIECVGYIDQDELLRLMGTVKIVSVPSVYSFPVASPSAIEPLLSETPVVSTDSISRDVLTNEVNGLVCESEPAAFADAFTRLISDRALWEKLSKGAAQAKAKFSAETVAKQYCEISR